jgi:circadian clock protein KaiB
MKPETESSQIKTEAGATGEIGHAIEQTMNEQYLLRLYIAGNNHRSQTAIENIRTICDENLVGRYELEIIDIYQDHVKKPTDLVIVAPTLIKELPLPQRRVIGDMTNKEKVLIDLDLLPKSHEK